MFKKIIPTALIILSAVALTGCTTKPKPSSCYIKTDGKQIPLSGNWKDRSKQVHCQGRLEYKDDRQIGHIYYPKILKKDSHVIKSDIQFDVAEKSQQIIGTSMYYAVLRPRKNKVSNKQSLTILAGIIRQQLPFLSIPTLTEGKEETLPGACKGKWRLSVLQSERVDGDSVRIVVLISEHGIKARLNKQ